MLLFQELQPIQSDSPEYGTPATSQNAAGSMETRVYDHVPANSLPIRYVYDQNYNTSKHCHGCGTQRHTMVLCTTRKVGGRAVSAYARKPINPVPFYLAILAFAAVATSFSDITHVIFVLSTCMYGRS